ncbi:M14 family metallopeptidase [Rufibacter ruber]|uniref:M14 family metallopeptidase n=1 Tax=Rufibacter ruber TaxID=1783499 RepID=UPI0009EEB9D0|nr:M14 family metallopeptidase [Rufibacter ruber]
MYARKGTNKFTLFIAAAAWLLHGCGTSKTATNSTSPAPVTTTQAQTKAAIKSPHIAYQEKQAWAFNGGSVVFHNQFAGARLNGVTQENDSTFRLEIKPENQPINPSPWYAFKVWSKSQKPTYVKLTYGSNEHRYSPKTSTDMRAWQDVPQSHFIDKTGAFFKVPVSQDTLIVAGQEMMTAAMTYRWMDSLAQKPFLKRQTIGQSYLGQPIEAFSTSGSDGKKLMVVLSRQHPPEVTGFMAMQEFVRVVTGDSPLAKRFREKFEVLIMPMLNPDGVDLGHWRHSAGGVDLKRDWETFKQPETVAVRDFIAQKTGAQGAKVYFMLDFHSTHRDVFYTNTETTPTHVPGFTNRWLKAVEAALPNYKANIRPSGNGGNVSKSWFYRTYNADAVTYEVGDDTPRNQIKLKGRIAAEKMMELLVQ